MSCLDMERENTENVIKMHAEVGKNGHSPYIDDVTQTWFVFDDISRKYVDTNIRAKGANSWEDIDGKPESFPPSEHNHDDRYYTGQDVDMMINSVRNEIPSINGYATESWVESKGYVTEETLNRPYELIEEITLTENVDSIARSTDTQGNAYNFKSVIIYARLAVNTENSTLRVFVNGLTNASITAQNAITTSDRYDIMEITCSRGVISGTNVNSNSINGSANIASTAFLAFGHSAITSFNITSTKGITSGSIIQIYGVRA